MASICIFTYCEPVFDVLLIPSLSGSVLFVILHNNILIFMYLILCLFQFLPTAFYNLHISNMCVCICLVKLEDSNWTDHCGPFFPFASYPPSLSLSLSFWMASTQLEPQRLKRGAWEGRNKDPSVCSHHNSAPPLLSPNHSSLPWSPRLFSISPLASAPN